MEHEKEFSKKSDEVVDRRSTSKKVMNAVYTFIGIPSSLLLAAGIVAVGGVMTLIAVIACLVLLGAGAAGIKHRETIKEAWRLRGE